MYVYEAAYIIYNILYEKRVFKTRHTVLQDTYRMFKMTWSRAEDERVKCDFQAESRKRLKFTFYFIVCGRDGG